MAINLSRNTKVYFTTNVNTATGVISDAQSGFTNANTFEITVLDGYSFSQGTQQQIVTIAEGGQTPVRGQRAFNTQLDPVDWSLSTYIRPAIVSTLVAPQELVLWNALFGAEDLAATAGAAVTTLTRAATTGAGAATATLIKATQTVVGKVLNINGVTNDASWNVPGKVTAVTGAGPYTHTMELMKAPKVAAGATASGAAIKVYGGQWAYGPSFSYTSSMNSNVNQLLKFGLIFVVDSAIYAVDNCAADSVSIDFGLDAIATAAWTGKGTVLKRLSTITASYLSANSLAANTTANYITNKLSTMTLQSNIGGDQNTAVASTAYTVAITGGNITIANNISYLVPSNLGVVNNAIGYYTGQRAVSGNVTAYLRTGETNGTGDLLANILAEAATTTEPKFRVQLEMGGSANANKVEFELAGAVLQVPTVDVADVVSTTINFTAQGFDPDVNGASTPAFDLTKTNDIQIRYFSS